MKKREGKSADGKVKKTKSRDKADKPRSKDKDGAKAADKPRRREKRGEEPKRRKPAEGAAPSEGLVSDQSDDRTARRRRRREATPEPIKTGGGDGAHTSVPRLLKKLIGLDPFGTRSRKVVRALSRLRREGAISLAEALSDNQWHVRYGAAAALQRMAVRYEQKDASEALSELSRTALEDDETAVRSMAIEALAALRMQRRAVLPILVRSLGDEDADVSRSAVMHIVELSTDSEDTTRRMIRVLEARKNVYSRIGAMLVLFHLGKESREAVPHLLKLLNDPAAEIREYAHLALLGIRTPSMRLEIVRTASMRLEVVEDELDEVQSEPASEDEDEDEDDEPVSEDEDEASSLEGDRLPRAPRPPARRRRRGVARARRRFK
jgi:HEAT repeat protein